MIKKNFAELSEAERQQVYKLIIKINKDKDPETYEAFIDNFSSIIFEYGKSLFCFWVDNEPIATIGIIVKDIVYKGDSFITTINVLDEYIPKLVYFMTHIEEFIFQFKPKRIKLGINYQKRELMPIFDDLGYKNPYEAFILRYLPESEKDLRINANISLERLDSNNKEIFKKINNDAFSSSPNGGIISDAEVIDYFENYKEKPDLIGILKFCEKSIGTYELTIRDSLGFIESIGISSEFQGKGFGKLLLQAAIKKLLEHGAKEIKLSVVSSNKKALNLYRKSGFEVDKIASIWLTKNIIN